MKALSKRLPLPPMRICAITLLLCFLCTLKGRQKETTPTPKPNFAPTPISASRKVLVTKTSFPKKNPLGAHTGNALKDVWNGDASKQTEAPPHLALELTKRDGKASDPHPPAEEPTELCVRCTLPRNPERRLALKARVAKSDSGRLDCSVTITDGFDHFWV
jgi:hypothetical protein